MTREEAIEKAFLGTGMKCGKFELENELDAMWIHRKDVVNFVSKIYNDFDSRRCGNCKYFTYRDDNFHYCDSKSSLNGLITRDFGCINWESKKEK